MHTSLNVRMVRIQFNQLLRKLCAMAGQAPGAGRRVPPCAGHATFEPILTCNLFAWGMPRLACNAPPSMRDMPPTFDLQCATFSTHVVHDGVVSFTTVKWCEWGGK